MVELLGDHRFFIGSDYPHAKGLSTGRQARKALAKLPEASGEQDSGRQRRRSFLRCDPIVMDGKITAYHR